MTKRNNEKYFDHLEKGRRVKILGKNETPVKNATVQFKMEYSEEMYDEPMYWCHIESTEKNIIGIKEKQ